VKDSVLDDTTVQHATKIFTGQVKVVTVHKDAEMDMCTIDIANFNCMTVGWFVKEAIKTW